MALLKAFVPFTGVNFKIVNRLIPIEHLSNKLSIHKNQFMIFSLCCVFFKSVDGYTQAFNKLCFRSVEL